MTAETIQKAEATAPSSSEAGSPPETGSEAQPQQQADEVQEQAGTETAKPAESKADGKKGEAKPGAPDAYEFKAPEGLSFDTETMKAYESVARELNLSQEAAQSVLDKVAPVMHQRQVEQIEAVRTEWATAAKADKEFGGDKFDANLAIAKAALDKFGTPELRAWLDETGAGSHPELIRAWFRAGNAIGQDTVVPSSGEPSAPSGPLSFDEMARRVYPNMK